MIDPGDSSVGLCWSGSQLPVARVGESDPRYLDALILFRKSDTLFLLKDCRPNRISESIVKKARGDMYPCCIFMDTLYKTVCKDTFKRLS